MRYVCRVRTVVAASFVALGLGLPASVVAQDAPAPISSLKLAVLESFDSLGRVAPVRAAGESEVPDPEVRPAALLPLYASMGVLQALDVHSTSRGIAAGGREANPVMQPIVGNRAVFIGVKAVTTAGVVWASEQLWRRQNRKAAIVLTAVTNIGLAAVVAHNYRAAR
jgi:hypothetical protein